MTKPLTTLEEFQNHGREIAKVSYDDAGFVFENLIKTTDVGVYAFVSNNTKIEKVGMASGAQGMHQRLTGYRNKGLKVAKGTADRTELLWHSAMSGKLKGQSLKLYFIPVAPIKETMPSGRVVTFSPVRDYEKVLSEQARSENQPMRLAGKGN